MYRKIIIALWIIVISLLWRQQISLAATVLQPGDIFPITASSTGSDMVEFVSRVDIDTGTILYFSDNAITSTGSRRTGEWYITITFTQKVEKWTIMRLNNMNNSSTTISPNGIWTIVRNGSFDLAIARDNMFIYQGTSYTDNSSFLYGLGFGTNTIWINSWEPDSNTSYRPKPLILGTTALEIISPSTYSIQYNCVNTNMLSSNFQADISNPNNWDKSNISYGNSPCIFSSQALPIYTIEWLTGSYITGSNDTYYISWHILSFVIKSNTIITDIESADQLTCDDIDEGLFENIDSYDCSITHDDNFTYTVTLSTVISSNNGIYTIIPSLTENWSFIFDDNNSWYGIIQWDYLAPDIYNDELEILSGVINETISQWVSLTDRELLCDDNGDGSYGSGNNCSISSSGDTVIDTNIPWVYDIIYTSTDFVGNTSTTIRRVTVLWDYPIIALYGFDPLLIELNTLWDESIDPWAECIVSGALQCDIDPIDYSVLDTTMTGDYTIIYTGIDELNRVAIGSRIISIIYTPATLTLLWSSQIQQGESWIDPGVRFDDVLLGSGIIVSSDTVDTSIVWNHYIIYTYTDHGGFDIQIVRKVSVIEASLPPITWWTIGTSSWGWYTIPIQQKENKAQENTQWQKSLPITPTQELRNAYTWAYLKGITTQDSLQSAALDRPITRAELAKMIVVYAQSLGKEKFKDEQVSYSDLTGIPANLQNYITLGYQYQLMGIKANGDPLTTFNPNGLVTRAELATILSRVLYGSTYNMEWINYYSRHLQVLKDHGIITNDNPNLQELRWWVMLMLMRTHNNS